MSAGGGPSPLAGLPVGVTLVIGRTWDGAPLPAAERAEVRLSWAPGHAGGPDALRIAVDAPFAGDPPPADPPGPTPRLWEHEVVELFVVGEGDPVPYTEIELGPGGHHLALRLLGVRGVVEERLPIAFEAAVAGARWTGVAVVPGALLPARPVRVNAYRISGPPEARRYHALVAVPGERPDFHQPARFAPWPL